MKPRIVIIALLIAALAVFFNAPRADAEPLTIMAIVGVASVLAVSSIDIIASGEEDSKEQRAQLEDTEKLLAKADPREDASNAIAVNAD
jgi:hypothetical protein